MRHSIIYLTSAALALTLSYSPADAKAKQCRDASGAFIACPASAKAPMKTTKTVKVKKTRHAAPKSEPMASAPRKGRESLTPAAKPNAMAPARPMTREEPALRVGAPAGATGKCKDGSFTLSKSRSGACSHHGGLAKWF